MKEKARHPLLVLLIPVGVILAFFFWGAYEYFLSSLANPAGGEIISSQILKTHGVSIFFSQGGGQFHSRRIGVAQNQALPEQIRRMLGALSAKPESGRPDTLWPWNLVLRNAYLKKNGILILDLENTVKYNPEQSATEELRMVQSVVRTLEANFRGIKAVKFMVGGQESETLAGHVDISRPLKLEDVTF